MVWPSVTRERRCIAHGQAAAAVGGGKTASSSQCGIGRAAQWVCSRPARGLHTVKIARLCMRVTLHDCRRYTSLPPCLPALPCSKTWTTGGTLCASCTAALSSCRRLWQAISGTWIGCDLYCRNANVSVWLAGSVRWQLDWHWLAKGLPKHMTAAGASSPSSSSTAAPFRCARYPASPRCRGGGRGATHDPVPNAKHVWHNRTVDTGKPRLSRLLQLFALGA